MSGGERETDRERERERDRQTDRQTETEKHRERERETHTHTHTHTHTETQREKERRRETERDRENLQVRQLETPCRKREQNDEWTSPTPFRKSLFGASTPPPSHPLHPTPSPPPGAESNLWLTMPSREQRGYQKSDPGEDHYYVGCLDQTRVSLPE